MYHYDGPYLYGSAGYAVNYYVFLYGRGLLMIFFFRSPQEQEQGSDGGQHGETDEFYQSAPTSGPTSHVQQPIRRRGGISAEHVSEEEATSYVKKVSVTRILVRVLRDSRKQLRYLVRNVHRNDENITVSAV